MAETAVNWGTGRRKDAVARVRLIPGGTGNLTVNGRPMEEYFPVKALQAAVLSPFVVSETTGKFDAVITVHGGGVAGQAGAVRHGIARSLNNYDISLRPALKKAGLLTRDPRVKERRKYGLKKARKRPQFSKR